MWRRGSHHALLVGWQIGGNLPSSVENSMAVPQKLKIEVPYDSEIPFLSIYPKKYKTLIQKDICVSMFIAGLFKIVKIKKQPKCPSIDNWIK